MPLLAACASGGEVRSLRGYIPLMAPALFGLFLHTKHLPERLRTVAQTGSRHWRSDGHVDPAAG